MRTKSLHKIQCSQMCYSFHGRYVPIPENLEEITFQTEKPGLCDVWFDYNPPLSPTTKTTGGIFLILNALPAQCEHGCKHGECVGPNKCKCFPGYTGKTCNQGQYWGSVWKIGSHWLHDNFPVHRSLYLLILSIFYYQANTFPMYLLFPSKW